MDIELLRKRKTSGELYTRRSPTETELMRGQGRTDLAKIMAYAARRGTGHLPVHQRLLQSAPKTLSIGLEKPGRLRTESGLNEHLGRHENATGPHYSKQPYEIRRMLTEGAVRAFDPRAQFVGLDNYVEAGGEILRDLFQTDDGGWLQDAALLETMVSEKLNEEAETIKAEGWKWIEVASDFPYGHTYDLRRIRGEAEPMSDEEEDDDGTKPLSDRLVCDLTVHRTMALRNALAADPQLAMLACLHTMVLQLFYHYGQDSCVEITPKATHFGAQAEGLGDTAYAQAIDQRIETWAATLPKSPEDLWAALTEWDSDSRDALFAHCVSMTVNAVQEPHHRKPRQIAHADVLAATLGLDMAKAGWAPTADSYLGRVTKAQILAAVRDAKGGKDADRIASFKKPDMVEAAEELLAGTDWLPAPLRTQPLVEQPDEPEFEIVDDGDVKQDAPVDADESFAVQAAE